MEFTPRIRDILLLLLRSDRPLGKQEIADQIGVSKRTAQREFESLEETIRGYGLQLHSVKGSGVYLEGAEEDKDRLRDALERGNVVGAEDKEERGRKILFTLLKDRSPKKLYYFSMLLGVSEATAANDMEQLRPWLQHYHLELVKRPGYGVCIDGAEKDFRAAMRRFIEDNGSARLFAEGNAGMEDVVMDSLHRKSIYSLLKQDTVDRVRRVLKDMKEPALLMLAENSYMGILIHIAIAVERVRKGGLLADTSSEELESLRSWEEYGPAERVLRGMEEEFGITMPVSEISYLMLHLRASKTAFTGGTDHWLKGQVEISRKSMMELAERMIDRYNPALSYEMRCDEEFLEGLMMHLKPVVVRIRHHLDIYNPMLTEIKEEYGEEFLRCREAAAVLEESLGEKISDEEVGFLTMHFGAEEEKLRNKIRTERKVTIGLVCASGFGLAKLMLQRIKNHISDNAVLHSYGKSELSPYVIGKTDFFISSLDLSGEGIDYIRVSPLIHQEDINRIQGKIQEYAHVRRTAEDTNFSQQLNQANFATREIKGIIGRFHHYEIDGKCSFSELLRFLAIEATGNLSAAGQVIAQIQERERLYSQIFPEMGLCILHCKTTAVDQAIFLSCTPRRTEEDAETVIFRDPYFSGIGVVVLMLIPEDEFLSQHQDVMGYLSSSFVRDPSFLKAFSTGSEDFIRDMLVKTLRKYFYELLERLS